MITWFPQQFVSLRCFLTKAGLDPGEGISLTALHCTAHPTYSDNMKHYKQVVHHLPRSERFSNSKRANLWAPFSPTSHFSPAVKGKLHLGKGPMKQSRPCRRSSNTWTHMCNWKIHWGSSFLQGLEYVLEYVVWSLHCCSWQQDQLFWMLMLFQDTQQNAILNGHTDIPRLTKRLEA